MNRTLFAHVLLALSFGGFAQASDLTLTDFLTLEPSPATGSFIDLNSDGTIFSLAPYTSVNIIPATSISYGSLLLWDPAVCVFRAGDYHGGLLPIGSAAFGAADADGEWSIAAGGGWAFGNFSAAFGEGIALGELSTAFNYGAYATGYASLAAGIDTEALGNYSTAFGAHTEAGGEHSFSVGEYTIAGALNSVAIGRWNVGAYTITPDANNDNDGDTQWIETDPIFEIGIGNESARANALTVYKSGKVIIAKAQGDILMGEFGNP